MKKVRRLASNTWPNLLCKIVEIVGGAIPDGDRSLQWLRITSKCSLMSNGS